MVVQNNLLNLNTNRQAVTMEKPEQAPKEKPVKKSEEKLSEDAAVNVTLTDASKRIGSTRPESIDRTLRDEDSRMGAEEADKLMNDTEASMMRAPGQSVLAQANQDPARVTSLLQ